MNIMNYASTSSWVWMWTSIWLWTWLWMKKFLFCHLVWGEKSPLYLECEQNFHLLILNVSREFPSPGIDCEWRIFFSGHYCLGYVFEFDFYFFSICFFFSISFPLSHFKSISLFFSSYSFYLESFKHTNLLKKLFWF